MFTYFTIASANKILPLVADKFKKILQQKDEIAQIEQQLESTLSTKNTLESYVVLKQKLNSVLAEFYQSIDDLESTGAVIKSVDEGLLDFPSKRFDDEVWLCWKYGEKEIKFWHEKDVGFSGRKPISVSNESLV